MHKIFIGNKEISKDSPVFIIAELSANHGGKIEIAKETIKAAAQTGADAIKLQTYTPDTITLDCDNEYFQIKQDTLWDGQTLYNLYKEAYMPWEWQAELKEYAESLGLICFSSPFDKSAVDFLESIHVPAYKIASFEITDIPLIEYVASKSKPIIISTGIAEKSDIQEAIQACHKMKNHDIILLKCTSAYPAPLEESNLLTIPNLAKEFDVLAGFSDHTLGIIAPVTAVALGAKIIEKHFILDREVGGPDASFSLDVEQFTQMVQAIRDTEKMLGKVTYELTNKSKQSREFSRSLFIAEDVQEGDALDATNVRSVRPAFGMHPREFSNVLGKSFKKAYKKGTPLSWDLIK
ncbi:MAG: pseudaminic acid synthase [Arcobacter sp.]|nr:MAG: pseudaminic acid synthase [Arcobacter sp.]